MPNQNNPDPNKATTPLMGQSPIPSVFPHSDLPPLPPDFQNVTNGVPQTPPVVHPTTQPGSFSNGSASPTNPLPPIIPPTPKKKFGGGRVIATILGIFLLIGGITGGVILTQQNQNLNEKADCIDSEAFTECRKTTGNLVCQCRVCGICTRPDSGTDPLTPAGASTPPITTGGVPTVNANQSTCTGNVGFWCAGCGGFCLSGSYTGGGCNNAQQEKCGETAQIGVVKCIKNVNGVWGSDNGIYGSAEDNQCKAMCVSTSNTCSFGTGAYICPQGHSGACTEANGQRFTGNINGCFCGVIQVDNATGHTSYENSCGCSTDNVVDTPVVTNQVTAPQCMNVLAYSSTWTVLTPADLSSLAVGTTINFCVAGSATDTFDMAQFKINTTLEPETTTPRPTTSDFCQSYTILSTDTTVNVQAKIHAASGWVGEPI